VGPLGGDGGCSHFGRVSFSPNPASPAFLLAELPILTLVMVYQSRGLVGFELRRDGRGKLQWALVILPGAALVSWAVRLPVHLLHGCQAWLAGAVAGLTLGATAMKADQKTPAPARYGALAIIAPFMWVSAFAGLSLFDIFADRGSPVGHFTALVNDHHPPDHNNAGPTLGLGPWGPVPVPTKVLVAQAVYDAVPDGESVCVTLHGGALGMAWYEVGLCKRRSGAD
jgi:hypothetical protein